MAVLIYTRRQVVADLFPEFLTKRAQPAVNELWSFRDDRHIASWQAAGYEGPALDVLTQAWAAQGGKRTVDEIAAAVGAKQDRADVERNIDALPK